MGCPLDENSLEQLIVNLSDELTDRNRPFTGQPHENQGERGKTEVRGIRFRDLADCICRAFVRSANRGEHDSEEMNRRADDGTLNYNDLYDLDLDEFDPIAVIQNTTCEVEKMMGIYPYVLNLNCDSDAKLE